MKIVVISGIFFPEIGGPSRYLFSLCHQLQSMGHSIEVVTFGETGPSSADPCPTRRISRKLPLPARITAMGKAIWKAARRADLLFVNDYGLPAVLVNNLLGKPMVMKLVGDFAWEVAVRRNWTRDDIDSFQHGRYPLRIRALKALRDYYVRNADRVIVPSDYLKKMATGWGVEPERIRVIYNAVDPEQYGNNQNEIPSSVQPWKDGVTILTVARLAPWKGIDAIIKALPGLPSYVRLLVAGDGPERPALERLSAELALAERVHFAGTIPLGEIHKYFKASDIFVLFSGYEGFSHALLEACRAGLAIVASNRGGNPELIQHRHNGLLVQWPETKELGQALTDLASNEDLRNRLGEAARATAVRFSWDELLIQTLSVLESSAKLI